MGASWTESISGVIFSVVWAKARVGRNKSVKVANVLVVRGICCLLLCRLRRGRLTRGHRERLEVRRILWRYGGLRVGGESRRDLTKVFGDFSCGVGAAGAGNAVAG